MLYNYHAHTKLCRHAEGEMEEYVKVAIDNGIKYMGFSDHIPFKYPGDYESGYRILTSEIEGYVSEINRLNNEYDNIDIKIGFETEYYPEYFETMFKNAVSYGAEYLILGQHFIDYEYPKEERIPSSRPFDDVSILKLYVQRVTDAMKTGVFTYIAHPDMIHFVGDKNIYREEIRKICALSKKLSLPLEINFQGIREGRNYPEDDFWGVAGEEQSPVTFGFDSHAPEFAYDGESLVKAKALVEKYNLNYIGKPKIVNIQLL